MSDGSDNSERIDELEKKLEAKEDSFSTQSEKLKEATLCLEWCKAILDSKSSIYPNRSTHAKIRETLLKIKEVN